MRNNNNNKFCCSSLLLLPLFTSLAFAIIMVNADGIEANDEYADGNYDRVTSADEGQFPAFASSNNYWPEGNDYYAANGRLLPPLLRMRRAQWRSIGRMVHLHRPSRPLFITRSIRDTPGASDNGNNNNQKTGSIPERGDIGGSEQEQMPAPPQQLQPQHPFPLMFTNRQGQRWECFFAPAFSCFVVKDEEATPQIMKKKEEA